MVLFDALGALGLRYEADANTPYAQVAQDRTVIDYIQYPDQFLESKTGDCDDCTVLYCSLLENVGIKTALVDAPGHVFMMFDTGISSEQQELLCLEKKDYVVYEDRGWVPVEVTMLGESFAKAWELGAEATSYLARSGQLKIYPIGQAWTEYQPAARPGTEDQEWNTAKELGEAISLDVNELVVKRETFLLRRYLHPLRQDKENHILRAELARVYVYLNRFDEAIESYEHLLEVGYQPAATLNNKGIAHFVAGDIDAARSCFSQALKLKPGEKGYQLNLEFSERRLKTTQLSPVFVDEGTAPTGTRGAVPFAADRFIWAEF